MKVNRSIFNVGLVLTIIVGLIGFVPRYRQMLR